MIIQWTKVKDAVSYRVAYREGKEDWTFVKVPLTSVNSKGEPRWDLKGAVEGGTYTFAVYADFADGSYTRSDNASQMRLITPQLSVKGYSGYVLLNWDSAAGCSRYKIYYREKGTNGWTLYAWVKSDVHEVKIKDSVISASGMPPLVPGKTYEFAVLSAISVEGITSGYPPVPVSLTIK